jgi:hypothetical protein
MTSHDGSDRFNKETTDLLDRELDALKELLADAPRPWLLMLAVAVLSVLDEKHATKVSLA